MRDVVSDVFLEDTAIDLRPAFAIIVSGIVAEFTSESEDAAGELPFSATSELPHVDERRKNEKTV